MNVQVVTTFTPRPHSEQWMDYIPLLRTQRATALHFGHKHLIVTDADMGSDFDQMRTTLPADLMPAMIAGVVARLQVPSDHHLVFVDADCLIARDLSSAFTGDFDIGLTRRFNPIAPINNGAMYVSAGSFLKVASFFKYALSLCGTYWGADQEAISKAASPVPEENGFGTRHGCRVQFLDMRKYSAVPKVFLSPHKPDVFVVHFKGKTKDWMIPYAETFLLADDRDFLAQKSLGRIYHGTR